MRKMLFLFLAASFVLGAPGLVFAEATGQLDYASWTKACKPDSGDGGRRVCLTSSSGKLSASAAKNAGQIVVSSVLIEREGDIKKTLRLILPLGVQLAHGTRIVVDSQKPIQAPYVNCYSDGCFSDYALDDDLLKRLKTGSGLVIQAINFNGSVQTFSIPLPGFERAFGASPSGWNELDGNVRTLLDSMLSLKSDADKVDLTSTPIYAPWTKFCLKGPEASAKQVCFTSKNGRIGPGEPVIAAVAIEPEGQPKGLLRVTLPVGIVQIFSGPRVSIDNNTPMQSPYLICFANGCMSDFELTPELLTRMKQGRTLVVQAIDLNGAALTLSLPLQETRGAGFSKAHDGPPTDHKIYEADQKKLQDEIAAKKTKVQRGALPDQAPTLALVPAPATPATHDAPASTERAASFGRRVALVIGNSAYRNVPALANPARDAAKVADALKNVGFQSVVLQTDLGREGLVEALRAFAKQAENADWALVYYAGHGIEVAGVNYLIPVDAAIRTDRDISLEAVPIDEVLSSAERARALRLVLLDACRDNPFADQMKRTLTVASRSVSRGLAQMEPDPGTLVIFAAKHGETALDGDGANSPFVTAFVKDIQVPGVEVRRLFDNVRDDVMDMTGRQQQPYAYGSVPGRQDFYFTAR